MLSRKSPFTTHQISRRTMMAGSLLAACTVAGCGLSPVYGTREGGQPAVLTELQSTFIEVPTTRVEQEIYNAVVFAFGQNPPIGETTATYRLDLASNQTVSNALVARSGEISARIFNLNTSFFIRTTESPKPLFRGSAIAAVPFDSPLNQQFADQRAQIDAENRAAKEVARQVATQISGYFASQR